MKWLLAEDWASHIYAEPFFQRLAELGEEVHAFRECEFFRVAGANGRLARWLRTSSKAQHRFRIGPRILRLNLALLDKIRILRPDVLFVFRGEHTWPSTLAAAKQLGVYVVGWQNDDPFSSRHEWYSWRHFRQSIPLYDQLYAYRHLNIGEFSSAGCKRVALLRDAYQRELNFPMATRPDPRYASGVSFCGHWEPDGRDAFVTALLDAADIDFRIWGTRWERSPLSARIIERMGQIVPAYKEDYNALLNSTKIALVFLSRLNRDTYTRRCFEIPAAKTFMLAQYTPDLASLFAEGKEAEYFREPSELVEKVRFYLCHDREREQIAGAGYARLIRDGHEAIDRARTVHQDVCRYRNAR
jgi:spore maturation protein CgeB